MCQTCLDRFQESSLFTTKIPQIEDLLTCSPPPGAVLAFSRLRAARNEFKNAWDNYCSNVGLGALEHDKHTLGLRGLGRPKSVSDQNQ